MNEKQVLREAMRAKGFSQSDLAKAAGYKTQSHIANILARPSMRVDVLTRLLDAMGYELIIRSKDEIKLPGTNVQAYTPEWVVTEDALEPDI